MSATSQRKPWNCFSKLGWHGLNSVWFRYGLGIMLDSDTNTLRKSDAAVSYLGFNCNAEGPSSQHLATLVPKTIPSAVSGRRNLKHSQRVHLDCQYGIRSQKTLIWYGF